MTSDFRQSLARVGDQGFQHGQLPSIVGASLGGACEGIT